MRILMIGAHQDDVEFRGSGLAAKYRRLGHDVRILSMTNGCGGHHIMTPAETTATRAKESAAVAKLLGVTYDVWDDQQDCALVADLETRRRLIRYIRKFSPASSASIRETSAIIYFPTKGIAAVHTATIRTLKYILSGEGFLSASLPPHIFPSAIAIIIR